MKPRVRPHVFWRAGGRGPALVLLNGWSASGLAWPRDWVRTLEASFHVIRVDNRGSGFSRFAPTPFTMADLADDVVDVLDAAEEATAVVAGVSMGGMIAQEFAMRHQNRLAGLVLVATRPPAPAYTLPRSASAMLDLLGPPRRGEGLDVFFTRLWTSASARGFAERHPELVAELVNQIVERPTPRAMLVHQLRAVNGWGHAERLRDVAVPTAIVHGREDWLVETENGRRLAQLIPGARLCELEGVGHLPPLEAPQELLTIIGQVSGENAAPPATAAAAAG
ncbi:MAG: alpha/beta hydrolase [Marmoricola sp.]